MKLVTLLIAAALIASPSPAMDAGGGFLAAFQVQQNNWSADRARDAQRQGQVLSAREIVSIARDRHPGSEVLDVSMSGGNNPRYTVILKTRDGRRIDVTLDARSGRVLSERGA